MDVPHPRDWWARVRGGHRPLGWSDLSGVERSVLGGFVVEYAERARSANYRERDQPASWEPEIRDAAVFRSIQDAVGAAARGRRPKHPANALPTWLSRAVRARLKEHGHFTRGDFMTIRLLELAGLVELEVDNDYVLSMMGDLVALWSAHDLLRVDPVAWFRQDPGLVDHALWKLFEVPGGGETSLTNLESAGHVYGSWQASFVTMIDEGMVPRDRVLDACLAALNRDFTAYQARWFAGLLKQLAPSTDELADRQPVLRRLLHSEVPTTVTLALRWLKLLDRAGRLDDEATAPALARPAVSKVKSTARASVSLLERIRRRSPHADVITGARAALGHPEAEVQRAAAALLRAAGDEATLAAEADLLEPSVRHELGLTSSTSSSLEISLTPVGHDVADLQPVTDRDLLERLAAVMEHPDDPLELELVLDRLAQCPDPHVLMPLVGRARKILKSEPDLWRGPGSLAACLAQLVSASAGGLRVTDRQPEPPLSSFLVGRLAEVERALTGRTRPAALLATPDQTEGWINAPDVPEPVACC